MKNQRDERSVYLALNIVFRGADAQVRRPKKIRELILKRQYNVHVRDLIQAHNIDNVCNAPRTLLEQQIFESTLKAKVRFPGVFEVSLAQSAERSASEIEAARSETEAARSETDALQNVAENSSRLASAAEKVAVRESCEDVQNVGNDTSTLSAARECSADSRGKKKHSYTPSRIPSLYPVYLPYQTQHKLLSTVQVTLESACYDFAKRRLPKVVRRERWECAESVELDV